MKVALVHELLTTNGGAENVLEILCEMFPDAPIYTLLYNEKKMGSRFPRQKIRTPSYGALHDLLPTSLRYNHHLLLKKFPKNVEEWDFFEYDLVISSSSAFTHGIITNDKPKHICYVHSPARYLWDRTHDVQKNYTRGLLGPLKKHLFTTAAHSLRLWDSEVAHRPNQLIAASSEVQKRIMKYWRRDSEVVYPPISDFWLQQEFKAGAEEHPDYYLVVSTLAQYKRIDIAIEACNTSGKHLKIIGEGPDMQRLKNIAGPTIEFYGYRKGVELGDIYASAKAVIFPGLEDFGLVPIEAMACGTPVIAYRGGGALETISEGSTGEFFDEPNPDSLLSAMKIFEQNNYSTDEYKQSVKHYTKSAFIKNMQQHIDQVLES